MKRITVFVVTLAMACMVGGLISQEVVALEIVGSVSIPDHPKKVWVTGTHAYVVESESIQVVDVSDPQNPIIVGSVDLKGIANDMTISGSYAYVIERNSCVADAGCTGWDGLEIIDISNPQDPVVVGAEDIPGYVREVYVSGAYAYVLEDDSIQVVDVSHPQNPIIVGSVDLKGVANNMTISGSYAYVTERRSCLLFFGCKGWDGLEIIDISNPREPVVVGAVDIPVKVYVSGTYAYVLEDDSIQVVDVSDPQNPIIVGSVDLKGIAKDMHISGNYAYVTERKSCLTPFDCKGQDGFEVVDIGNPQDPVVAGAVDIPGKVYFSGSNAYVVESESLQVIDVSDPRNPTMVGSVDLKGIANDMHISGSYAYMTEREACHPLAGCKGWDGLEVIDISDFGLLD